MRRLIISILLVVAFVAGYCAGRSPNSPDVIAWAKNGYGLAADLGQRLAEKSNSACNSTVQSSR